MKKRLICAFLALVMLIGMVPATTVSADEPVTVKTSEKAIALLKEMEGFSKMAYYDHGQYSIGYGTACQKNEYPNGITETEADALLRSALADMEVYMDRFVSKYSLNLTQNQYDALMMFTYNLGAGWTTQASDFRSAVINGYTGNDFIFYISRWCKAGGSVSTGLVKRRLAEADMYLYGYYALHAPGNYSYVIYDGNEGESDSSVQGYDASQPGPVKASASREGYRFLGWYTAPEGGRWVSHLDATTKAITLYAHWQGAEESEDPAQAPAGTQAAYSRNTTERVTVYELPSTGSAVARYLAAGTSVNIVADYVDTSGVKWGQLKAGGWIVLSGTEPSLTADPAPERVEEVPEEDAGETVSVSITVTGTNVNYRSGPGTDYAKLGTLDQGQVLTITQVKQVGTAKWGKFDSGWVCLTYTDYDAVIAEQEAEDAAEPVIATGVIVNCSSLRIRTGPGTGYDVAGTLTAGSQIEIYEIVTGASMQWGRISSGWVGLNYVDVTYITSDDEPSEDPAPEETEPEEQPEESVTTEPVEVKVTAGRLNIRSAPSMDGNVVGSLNFGVTVTVTEQKSVDSVLWGKIENGWICMDYVKIIPEGDTPAAGPLPPSQEDTDPDAICGVVNATGLRVRSGPGTGYDVVTTLANGTAVVVTQQKHAGGMVWGKIENGWICMSYVTLAPVTDTGVITGTVIASALTIRSAAGITNAILGRYARGTVVQVFETATVGGTLWGRTSKGWICMDYLSY